MAGALQELIWQPISSLYSSSIRRTAFSFSSRSPAVAWNRSPLSPKKITLAVARNAALRNNANTRERQRLKDQFKSARERCLTDPLDGVPFTVEEFLDAVDKYDFQSEVRNLINGTVFHTDAAGALVDVTENSSAYLPIEEACIYKIKHINEAGIVPGFQENFTIIGKNADDGSLILSLKPIQYSLSWERCRQLQAEDAVVIGKVIGGNRRGVVVLVEGLRGFLPFSQMPKKSTLEDSIGKELPLKILEVNEERSKLLLSNLQTKKFMPGAVVTGKVETLKPYGAIINVSGLIGLLHISQISHHRVNDVSAIFKPGDVLKSMVLSYDQEKGRMSLSTKKLESAPGEMLWNPNLVYDQAEEMARVFLRRIVEAEEMARAADFSASESEVLVEL